jgi:membrane protease YdiL (CAAX protease family)
MIPHDPAGEALSPASSAQSAALNPPFWNYADLLLFILLGIPSLGVAYLVAELLSFTPLSLAFRLILAQVLWYGLTFGALKALLLLRYQQPFWRSLGWKSLPFSATTLHVFAGPMLALALGLLGAALHTPEIPLPFQQLLKDRPAIILLGLLVVVLGPLCEELGFRGFLMPLFIRSLGPAAGILITGIIFGCAHGYEYEWSWRHMLLISVAGCVFGWAKYKTGSTAASAFMHSTFNLTQFAALLINARTL